MLYLFCWIDWSKTKYIYIISSCFKSLLRVLDFKPSCPTLSPNILLHGLALFKPPEFLIIQGLDSPWVNLSL